MLGDHMRSVLMRSSMHVLRDQPTDQWRLRDHANIIYTFFPTTQLLVQKDHVVWINSARFQRSDRVKTGNACAKITPWRRSVLGKEPSITSTTLNEDFVIGESIQNGFASGANDVITFGRLSALPEFNRTIKRHTAA